MPIYLEPLESSPSTITELGANQKIVVTIPRAAGLTATDGTELDSNVVLTFVTEASPTYASVDYVILGGGELLDSVPEAAIYGMIYAASTLVDDILLFDVDTQFPDKTTKSWRFFNRARTEFVKCKAIADLMRAVISSRGTSAGRKLLADFSVDNSNLAGLMTQARPLLQDYIQCYQYWQKVLFAGGAVDFESPKPKGAVWAGNKPDGFGGIGRSWVPDSDNLRYKDVEYQDGNTRTRPARFGDRNPLADWFES